MWADVLSRWWYPTKTGRVKIPKRLDNPLLQRDFVWPSLVEVRQSQDLVIASQLNLQFDPERKIWVNGENIYGLRTIISFDYGYISWKILDLLGPDELTIHSPLSKVSVCGQIWRKRLRHSVSHAYIVTEMAIVWVLVLWEKPCMKRLATRFCTLISYWFLPVHPIIFLWLIR